MNYVLLSLFCSLSLCAVPFAYDTAALRAKEGDWNGALDQFKNLVTRSPDDASILYDTGVASFHVGDCTHAIAYFEQAAESAHDPLLQEKSLINLGTTYAKTGDFKRAIPPLERALVLNPFNESARTKLEEFKKKCDEEQQKDSHDNTPEEQQEEPSSENENKDSDREGDDTSSDKKSQKDADKGTDNTTDNKERQKQDSQTNDASSESESESGSEQEQSGDDSDRNTQNERSNRPESNADQSSPGTDKAPQNSKDAEASTPPDTSSAETPGKQEGAEQAKEMGEAALDEVLNKEENQWMRTLLERYEKHDIEGNKQLLRGRLQQRGAENACDKNW